MLTREQSMLLKVLYHLRNQILKGKEVPAPHFGLCANVNRLLFAVPDDDKDNVNMEFQIAIQKVSDNPRFPVEKSGEAYCHKNNQNKYQRDNPYYTRRMYLLSNIITYLENLEKEPEHVPTPVPVNDSNTLRSDQV